MDRGYFNPATMDIIIVDIEISCSHSADKYIRTKNNSILHWNGSSLRQLDSSFKLTTIDATENIPNYTHTHIHLIANLIDHPERSDFDTMTNMIESSSINILQILSISSNNGNVLFDHHTLMDAAIQSVTIMTDVASNVLNTIFLLHKIITILVLTIVIIMLIITIIFIIRCYLRRKRGN